MNISLRELRLFVRLSRPIFLVGGALLYGLGAAIASYLGRTIDATLYIAGQVLITSLQLMAHFLNEYYDAASDADNDQRTWFSGGSGALGPDGLPKQVALYAAVVSLVIAATLASVLLFRGVVPLAAWLVLGMIFLGAFFYSSPPVRLITSGYGELSTSLLVAGLLPTFAFTLQTGELHRLLLMSTTPLVALHFAMMLTFELPDYASDLKNDKRTLMVRIGWATAMRLHDIAILFATLTFAIAFLYGLPRRVGFGALIALPLALAQIWQMDRLRRGFPARWRTQTLGAIGLFALSSYLVLTGYLLS
jgi:1,4-dihydroxy-2-naphthoate octaprenyltransferase